MHPPCFFARPLGQVFQDSARGLTGIERHGDDQGRTESIVLMADDLAGGIGDFGLPAAP